MQVTGLGFQRNIAFRAQQERQDPSQPGVQIPTQSDNFADVFVLGGRNAFSRPTPQGAELIRTIQDAEGDSQ